MFKLRLLVVVLCVLFGVVAVQAQDAPPTITLGESALGPVLVGPDGFTLYMFSVDALDASNCYEACVERWTPLIVGNPDTISLGEGIPGEIGTFERTTGTNQVTYNGMALYYWFLDVAPGDTRGQGVGNVWWVVPPATVYIENDDALGATLVGPTGMTLYMFTNDAAGVSNCADQCAVNWPPLTVESADAVVAGVNLPGTLATIERADGTLQVTYNDMPLYYWKDDAARGDTLGEGVGDVWYTIAPETVSLSDAGDYLVTASGRTLYTSSQDAGDGVTTWCEEDCLANWTPFTVAANDRLVAGADISGALATTALGEGQLQVTYNGMLLFTSRADRAAGDVNGADDVWSVAAP
jgi:predicted lipoprotein with Yx(FWY)xxD motif